MMAKLPFDIIGPSYFNGKRIPDEVAELLILEYFDELGEEKFPM